MSLAVCTKNHNQIAQHDYFPLINGLKFVVLNSTNGVKHSFLVIYRKQSTTIPGFITELEHILYNHDIDVVLGDFNIDYMNSDDCNPLKSMMQSLNFEQVVKEPTFISSGTLLDHIYLKSSRFNVLENKVISVYYSDHDAIKISIQKIQLTNTIHHMKHFTYHIWAENAPVDEHNNKHLQQLSGPVYTLEAEDQYPSNLAEQDIDKVLSKGRSDNGGLDAEIQVKKNARVMVVVNVDINDRLINGQMGTIARIVMNQNTNHL